MTPSNGDHRGPAPDANASSYPEYKLGHTAKEVERMRNQHEWIKGSFGGLIKAPIDYFKQGQKILDSATADGTWLYDISTLFPPETEMVGFDIAPELYRSPDDLPPNVKLVPGDLTKDLPAEWNQKFDLVHQRFICPAFPGATVKEFIGKLMACVKPGGWIQLVEPAADENVAGPDAAGFAVLHRLAAMFMGSPNPKDAIVAALKEGGFINVGIESLDIVVGVYQSNKELDARGRKNMRAVIRNMIQMVDLKALGEKETDKDTILARFDADMEKYRCGMRHTIIWAQRPE